MRPLLIDFLAEPSHETRRMRSARRLVWALALLIVAIDLFAYGIWRADHARLTRDLDARNAATGPGPAAPSSPTAPELKAFAGASSFDPAQIGLIERTVLDIRNKFPEGDLTLLGMAIDGQPRKLALQGEALQHPTVNALREHLLAQFPQAIIGFPSIQNSHEGRRLQFEIALRFAPSTGNAR